jgi:GMP synthase-like glutamine amidotransferase
MQPIAIFRHIACEGPGYLGDFLQRNDVPYEVIAVDAGEPIPKSIDGLSALVFMGGPMSVNDDLPWIAPALALIRQAQAAGLPLLGHCLGGQLIAKALGGTIGPNPVKEIGWLPVQRAATDAARDWLGALPDRFTVFHWHGETFSLPPDAHRILQSEACANQGFVLGKTLALQCHVEITADMVGEWADLYAHETTQPSTTVQSKAAMMENLGDRVQALQTVADKLYNRWLQGLAE